MNSLAALKRIIQPGLQLLAVEHWQPKLIGTVRTVIAVQGNGYWYRIPGDDRRMWSSYGKASEFTFPAADTYRYECDGHGWTLRILPSLEPAA